jgi:glyoxylase-like metal-dependent hydrolase (beta-lactamase superfamily II)
LPVRPVRSVIGLARSDLPSRFAVYAVEYGRREGVRGEHFLGWDVTSGDRHDTAYYAWLLLSADRTVLVDAGMDRGAGRSLTGWSFRSTVPDVLSTVGIAVGDIDTVVLTHLHYDHAGGVRSLSRARVVVQRAELAYWTGPAAKRNAREAWLVDQRDLAHLAALTDLGRVDLVDGDTRIAAGLSVHLVGGHTAGTQLVMVRTAAGRAVLASDAVHFFENLETDRPGTILHSMPGVYSAFDRARELAAGGPIVPGHDPAVMTRFGGRPAGPAAGTGLPPGTGLPAGIVRIA